MRRRGSAKSGAGEYGGTYQRLSLRVGQRLRRREKSLEKARERRRPTTTKPTTTTTATTTYLARRRRPRRLVITCTELVVRTTFSISPYRLIREPFAPPYFATRTRSRIIPSRRPRRCRSRHRIVHPTYDRRNHAELTLVICSLCDRFLEPPPPFPTSYYAAVSRCNSDSPGALVPWSPGRPNPRSD